MEYHDFYLPDVLESMRAEQTSPFIESLYLAPLGYIHFTFYLMLKDIMLEIDPLLV